LIAAPDPTTATLERSAIEEKYKWDLSKMYVSQEEWRRITKKVESMINEFAAKTARSATPKHRSRSAEASDQININSKRWRGLSHYAEMRT